MELDNTEITEEVINDEIVDDLNEEIDEVAEEYTPNLVYKVKDEERTFDERLKDIIKSKDDEEYFRDLYTKADGLDSYKEKVSHYESSLNEYRGKLDKLSSGYRDMVKYRDEGDFRKLFGSIGLNDDAVLEYALKLVEESQMPEEQRQVIEQNRKITDEMEQLRQQVKQYEDQINGFTQQSFQSEVDAGVKELQGLVSQNQDLDSFMTSNGLNLVNEVLDYGMNVHRLTGKEPAVAEAFAAVQAKYSKFMPSKEATVETIIKNRPDSLPVVNGSNQSSPEEKMTLDKLISMRRSI